MNPTFGQMGGGPGQMMPQQQMQQQQPRPNHPNSQIQSLIFNQLQSQTVNLEGWRGQVPVNERMISIFNM